MGNHISRAAVTVGEDKLAHPPLVLYTATPQSMSTVELKMWADQFKGLLDEDSILYLYEKFKTILLMSSPEEMVTMNALRKREEASRHAAYPSTTPEGGKQEGENESEHSPREGVSNGLHAPSQAPVGGAGLSFRKQPQVCTGIFPRTFQRYMLSTGAFKGTILEKARSSTQRRQKHHSKAPTHVGEPSGASGSGDSSPRPSQEPTGGEGTRVPMGAMGSTSMNDKSSASSSLRKKRPVMNHCFSHLFRAFDADRDGIISFSDFLVFHAAMGYHTEEHLAAILFYAYDADGDNWISYDDLVNVLTASTSCVGDLDLTHSSVARVIHAEAQRLMAFLDVYRTGRVSEEVLHLLGQRHPEILEKMRYLL